MENTTWQYRSYIVRTECLPVCRILKKKSLKTKDLRKELLCTFCERVQLQFSNIVFADDLIHDIVEFVEYFDP